MTARLVRTEIEVPGTPEEVWEAIATGPGSRAGSCPRRSTSASAARS